MKNEKPMLGEIVATNVINDASLNDVDDLDDVLDVIEAVDRKQNS